VYACATCKLAVIVLRDGEAVRVVRACLCGGPIVAEMRVAMKGQGGGGVR